MKIPPPNLIPLVERAAALRAEGRPWDAVGKDVSRSPETCRRWPREYPDAWTPAFRSAAARMLDDAGAEAVTALRALLRSGSETVRLKAAKILLDAAAALRGPPAADAAAAGVPGLPPDLGFVSADEYAAAEATCRQEAADVRRPLPADRPVPVAAVAAAIRSLRADAEMTLEEQLDLLETVTPLTIEAIRREIAERDGTPPPPAGMAAQEFDTPVPGD